MFLHCCTMFWVCGVWCRVVCLKMYGCCFIYKEGLAALGTAWLGSINGANIACSRASAMQGHSAAEPRRLVASVCRSKFRTTAGTRPTAPRVLGYAGMAAWAGSQALQCMHGARLRAWQARIGDGSQRGHDDMRRIGCGGLRTAARPAGHKRQRLAAL